MKRNKETHSYWRLLRSWIKLRHSRIQKWYKKLLQRWRTGQALDLDSSLVFTQIAILFL